MTGARTGKDGIRRVKHTRPPPPVGDGTWWHSVAKAYMAKAKSLRDNIAELRKALIAEKARLLAYTRQASKSKKEEASEEALLDYIDRRRKRTDEDTDDSMVDVVDQFRRNGMFTPED